MKKSNKFFKISMLSTIMCIVFFVFNTASQWLFRLTGTGLWGIFIVAIWGIINIILVLFSRNNIWKIVGFILNLILIFHFDIIYKLYYIYY